MTETIVAAAIVRDGLVLAARRTRPAALAGRWELPGGRVETAESAEAALVREIAEELACAIVVRRWLDGSVAIGPELVLRVALCKLTSGEPTGSEHDALAWLAAADLDDQEWLDADRAFMPALKAALGQGLASSL